MERTPLAMPTHRTICQLVERDGNAGLGAEVAKLSAEGDLRREFVEEARHRVQSKRARRDEARIRSKKDAEPERESGVGAELLREMEGPGAHDIRSDGVVAVVDANVAPPRLLAAPPPLPA